ncbi:hypothetical protein HCA61_24175 [Rhodococcus sp. HNM0563]|uniref:DUF7373 family lipoprotein n=1 Tax=Rhodococcus sp. HNM0563 TaxID=2716339 RepID=UPI00146CC0F4|nr:hypothetical protein [Rhodococcus sp. HNM0563]NLU65330.1 hypothetical protein [Rhodococcus sp. HNM0563]
MRTSRSLIAATAVTLALAGCSTTSEGTALAEGEANENGSTTGTFDIAALDTGEYRIEPRDFIAEGQAAGDFGPAVEGQRMAEFVIHPYTIDPTLTNGGGMSTGVGVGGIGKVLSGGGAPEVAESYGVITGFGSFSGKPDGSRQLGVAVWRFPDADSASQAAAALHANALAPEDDGFAAGPQTPVSIPQLPDTFATTYYWESLDTASMSTFTARGPHVVYTYTSAENNDVEWASDTTARALEEQLPRIEQFPFSPTDEIESLPVDLDKVLARAVGYTENEYARNSDTAVYGPLGWLHFDSHPAETADIFEATGTDRVALANSTVYRTSGPEAARELRDAFREQSRETYPDLVDEPAPQGVPDTLCRAGDIAEGRLMDCMMIYGPYVAQLIGHRAVGNTDPDDDTLRTMPQRVATQYTKFVRAEELGLGEN